MKNSGDKIIRQQVDNMQVSFDKEAAWMKLQERLESKDEKKRNSRSGWVAAAVLLLATVLWYSLQDNTRSRIVKSTIQEVRKNKVTDQELNTNHIHQKTEEEKPNIITHNTRTTNIPRREEVSEPIAHEPVTEPVIVQEATPIAIEKPIQVTAAKPKMRTIHINELVEEERIERKMQHTKYADNRKIFFIKPAIEREDTKEPIYSLFGANKETAN
jgi:cytoskeletal protein RodZ